jgi:cell division septation protein DedD
MELLIKHAKSKPKPLSHVSVDRDIPTSIENVVLKALSKSPADRQQTSSQFGFELISAIEEILDKPAQTLPEWPNLDPELFVDEAEIESRTALDYETDFRRPPQVRKIFIILLLLSLGSATAVLWQGAQRLSEDAPQVIARPLALGTINSPQQAQLEPDSVRTEAEIDNLGESMDPPIGDSFAVDHTDSLENPPTVVPESSPVGPDAQVMRDDSTTATVPQNFAQLPENNPEIAELSVDDALSKIAALKREVEDEEISSPPILTPQPTTTPLVRETEFLTPGWYVQVTAKEDKVEAEQVSAKLIKAGFTVAHQGASVGGIFYHRVLIGPLSNLEEAKHTKNRIVREKLHDEVPFIKKSQ